MSLPLKPLLDGTRSGETPPTQLLEETWDGPRSSCSCTQRDGAHGIHEPTADHQPNKPESRAEGGEAPRTQNPARVPSRGEDESSNRFCPSLQRARRATKRV